MRLLAYPDSALGKRREHVVFASHSINGYESAILYPSAKKYFKKFFIIFFEAMGIKQAKHCH